MPNPNQVILSPQTQMILGANASAFAQAFENATQRVIAQLQRDFGALGMKNESIFSYVFSSAGVSGFVSLPASTAVIPATFRVNEDADFVGVRMLAVAVDAGTGAVIASPSFTIELINTGSDRNLQNFPVHVSNLAGNAQNSIPFPKTMLYPRSALVQANFQNVQPATAINVQVSVFGYKQYDRAGVNEMIRH